MDFAQELGRAIRQARKDARLTQVELAALVGISDKTMRDIERGRPGPSFKHVLDAAGAVGIRLTINL